MLEGLLIKIITALISKHIEHCVLELKDGIYLHDPSVPSSLNKVVAT